MVRKLTDNEIAKQTAVAQRAAIQEMREPWWPLRAHYRAGSSIEVELRSGVRVTFPVAVLGDELRAAKPAQLRQVEVWDDGLHWEDLDVDVSLPGLITEALGSAFIHRMAGHLAGQRQSRRKAEAARENGAQGGRPSKATRRKAG